MSSQPELGLQMSSASSLPCHHAAKHPILDFIQEHKVFANVSERTVISGKKHIYSVLCTVCDQSLDYATVQTLDRHLQSDTHKALLDCVPEDGLNKRQTLHRNKLLEQFADSKSLIKTELGLLCVYCSKPFPVNSKCASLIGIHVKGPAHIKNMQRASDHSSFIAANNQRLAKQQTDRYLEIAITGDEEVRHQLCTTDEVGKLYCMVCSRSFECQPDKYKQNVENHLCSKEHKDEVKRQKKKYGHLYSNRIDGKTSPNPTPPKRICPRVIGDEVIKKCTKMVIEEDRSFRSASVSGYKSIINLCGRTVSSQTLRGKGLDMLYNDAITNMTLSLKDRNIWVMLDETTYDSRTNPHVLVKIGSLDDDHIAHSYHSVHIKSSPNHQIIYDIVKDSLVKLYGSEEELAINCHKVKLLVSDGASYMVKAGKLLKSDLLPHLCHVTCIVHAMHNVAEVVRKAFPELEDVIIIIRKLLSRSHTYKSYFKEAQDDVFSEEYLEFMFESDPKNNNANLQAILGDTQHTHWTYLLEEAPISNLWELVYKILISTDEHGEEDQEGDLPPHPVITRFGTYLVTISYYHHYFVRLINFAVIMCRVKISALDKLPKERLTKFKSFILDPVKCSELKEKIDYVYDHFCQLPLFICRLEKQELSVDEAEKILKEIRWYLSAGVEADSKFDLAHAALEKFEQILDKNKGLQQLLDFAKESRIYESAPTTSVDLERAFGEAKRLKGLYRNFGEKTFGKLFLVKQSFRMNSRMEMALSSIFIEIPKYSTSHSQAGEFEVLL